MTAPRAADQPDDELLEARFAVQDLLARYCMAVDDGRFDAFGELFEPEGEMHVMGVTHSGREAVRSFMEAAQPPEARGRHSMSATVLELDTVSGTGSGWVDYVFFDTGGSATSIGRYHDRYVLGDDGRWRFELREIVFLGGAPELASSW